MPGRTYAADDYRYGFGGQEKDDEIYGDGNIANYKYRMHDPRLGRFFAADPLTQGYPWNSPYAFAENKVIQFIELEGLEIWLPLLGVSDIFVESDIVLPRTGGVSRLGPGRIGGGLERLAPLVEEGAGPIPEIGAVEQATPSTTTSGGTTTITPKPKLPAEILERFNRGRATETEQLRRLGLDKNNQPYEAVDPKTGESGTTIPDAFDEEGAPLEIKDVQEQALTKQLRLQKQVAERLGTTPRLHIRQGAKLTQPLQDGGFDITYFAAPPVLNQSDATQIYIERVLTVEELNENIKIVNSTRNAEYKEYLKKQIEETGTCDICL